ncbi:MAG: leucine-rich repeat domain-containing protein [Treponema sp.]|nr:leucine-rich repeat domain-containing protein [Treponema sp.]
MKTNYISDLTLELYHLDALAKKERQLVETTMTVDSELYTRYEALKNSDKEIQQFYLQEKKPVFKVININNDVRITEIKRKSRNKKILTGLGIAAVLLCVFIPMFIYFIGNNSGNKTEVITDPGIEHENKLEETNTPSTFITEDTESSGGSTERIVVVPNEEIEPELRHQPVVTENQRIDREYIAIVPDSQTGIYTRGGTETEQQTNIPPETSGITIPEGITFIFDSMFANRQLTSITIPDRITFIGDNAFVNNQLRNVVIPRNVYSIGSGAFTGNPLISVTIGANVIIDDDTFPGNFAAAYNRYGKTAGAYTRLDLHTNEWIKQ